MYPPYKYDFENLYDAGIFGLFKSIDNLYNNNQLKSVDFKAYALFYYDYISDYILSKVNIGAKGNDYMQTLTDSWVRIMRVRTNEGNSEIPGYTEWNVTGEGKREHKSASGIYQFGKVFWGLASRPNDFKYFSRN